MLQNLMCANSPLKRPDENIIIVFCVFTCSLDVFNTPSFPELHYRPLYRHPAARDVLIGCSASPWRPRVSTGTGSERGAGDGRTSFADWAGRLRPPAPTGRPMTACPAAAGPAHREETETPLNL